jgi:hypothetical protein
VLKKLKIKVLSKKFALRVLFIRLEFLAEIFMRNIFFKKEFIGRIINQVIVDSRHLIAF